MIIENGQEKTIQSHENVLKTYKELKKILPIGYIKMRVSEGQKYSIQKNSVLNNLEKDKIKCISNKFLYNKNIYLYSDQNKEAEKFLTKIRKLHSQKKMSDIYQNNNEADIFKNQTNQNYNTNNINVNNINTLKNYVTNSTNINSINETDSFTDTYIGKGTFKSSMIKNCFMKKNVFLPSITHRLKFATPRYDRQVDGFLIRGVGKYSSKETTADNKEMTANENKNIYDTINLIKYNKLNNFNTNLSHINDDKKKELIIQTNGSNDKRSRGKNHFLDNIYNSKELKITGIKKITHRNKS